MTGYDFTSLSPLDFELLVADLLRAEFGIFFESFGPGPDKGIDLRYASSETTIIQCKHYARTGLSGLKRELKNELKSWAEHVAPERYIVATSVSLSPQSKASIVSIIEPILPLVEQDVIGREDLNSLLRNHPEVELAHFKLWITSTAIMQRLQQNGIWIRSEDLLESIEARMRFYVSNANFPQVLSALDASGVCIISGDPGVGKSLLAEMALLSHSGREWQVVQVSEDMREGDDAWNQNVPQIFYYDDFLGQTAFAEALGKNEDARIIKFVNRVRRAGATHKRFILTTRSQVLREALESSDQLRSSEVIEAAIEVRLGDYNIYARGAILFNHLYFSNLATPVRNQLVNDGRLLEFVHHRNYNPRIVELVLRRTDGSAEDIYADLQRSLDDPTLLWAVSFSSLSTSAQNLLLALLTHPVVGANLSRLQVQVPSSSYHAVEQALKVLEGTWIKISRHHDGTWLVAFANPSCRDFLLGRLENSHGYIDALIAMAKSFEELMLIVDYAREESRRRRVVRAIGPFAGRTPSPTPKPVKEGADGDRFSRVSLKARLKDHGESIVASLRSSYVHKLELEIPTGPAFRGPLLAARSDSRAYLLATLVYPIEHYGSDPDATWLLGEIGQLRSDAWDQECSSCEDLLELYRILSRSVLLQFDDFLHLLTEAARYPDDLDDLESLESAGALRKLPPDDVASLLDVAAQMVRDEFNSLRVGFSDGHDVTLLADQIEGVTRSFDLDDREWHDELNEIASLITEQGAGATGPTAPREIDSEDDGGSEISDDERLTNLFESLRDVDSG